MGSSLVGVYTTTKIFSVENFKHEWKKWHGLPTWQTFLFLWARGVLWRSNFWGNLEPLNKKLDLVRTPTRGILIRFSILFAIPTFASNQPFFGYKFSIDRCISSLQSKLALRDFEHWTGHQRCQCSARKLHTIKNHPQALRKRYGIIVVVELDER
jgi:hypothetical protein